MTQIQENTLAFVVPSRGHGSHDCESKKDCDAAGGQTQAKGQEGIRQRNAHCDGGRQTQEKARVAEGRGEKNAAKKARRTSSALPRAAHTITGRDSAEDARVARHKARREYWSRFAVEHRTELDELIAALLAFFQRAFKADFEIRSRHHLVYVFELTAPRWSLFAPAINQLPLI